MSNTLSTPKTEDHVINGSAQPAVPSWWLHEQLGVSSRHNDWFRDRITKYDFREGIDFVTTTPTTTRKKVAVKSPKNGQFRGENRIDHWMTLTMAKELCMIQNNDVGRRWRRYFIQKEEEHREDRISQALRDMIVLEMPKPWQKFVPDDFVYEVARLWGLLDAKPGKTPQCFGWLYNKVLYLPLWDQLPEELKAERKKSGKDSAKLHQFLADHPKKLVETHMLKILGMMSICDNMDQFIQKFDARHELQNQLMLPFKKGSN